MAGPDLSDLSPSGGGSANADALARGEFMAGVFGIPQIVGGAPTVFLEEPLGFFGGGIPTPYRQPGRPEVGAVLPKSSHQVLARLVELPEPDMIKWKNAIYDAGLYEPSYYSRGIRPRQVGLMDDEDRKAFVELMYISTRAPKGTTVQGVLEKLGSDNPYSAKNNYGRVTAGQVVQTVDPATVRKYADAAAQTLLGRALDDKTMAQLVQNMVATQTGAAIGAAQKEAAVAPGQVATTQAVDVAARTEEAVEATSPAEAEAKRFASGYDVFMKLITGGA